MQLVGVAAGAILLPLHPLGVESLVLAGEVVAILTIAAGQNDFVARHEIPSESMSDVRCPMPDVRCPMSDIGYRLSVIGYRLSVIGHRVSGIGYRVSVIGYRLLEN